MLLPLWKVVLWSFFSSYINRILFSHSPLVSILAEIYWTPVSSYVCLRSLCTRQSLIVIAFGGFWETVLHCVLSDLFVSGPAAVLLLNGNSEWHLEDAAGPSELLPAALFIIMAELPLKASSSVLTLNWTKQNAVFFSFNREKLVHVTRDLQFRSRWVCQNSLSCLPVNSISFRIMLCNYVSMNSSRCAMFMYHSATCLNPWLTWGPRLENFCS